VGTCAVVVEGEVANLTSFSPPPPPPSRRGGKEVVLSSSLCLSLSSSPSFPPPPLPSTLEVEVEVEKRRWVEVERRVSEKVDTSEPALPMSSRAYTAKEEEESTRGR